MKGESSVFRSIQLAASICTVILFLAAVAGFVIPNTGAAEVFLQNYWYALVFALLFLVTAVVAILTRVGAQKEKLDEHTNAQVARIERAAATLEQDRLQLGQLVTQITGLTNVISQLLPHIRYFEDGRQQLLRMDTSDPAKGPQLDKLPKPLDS